MNRIDEVLAQDRNGRTAAEYYGDPSEYPDCPMPGLAEAAARAAPRQPLDRRGRRSDAGGLDGVADGPHDGTGPPRPC